MSTVTLLERMNYFVFVLLLCAIKGLESEAQSFASTSMAYTPQTNVIPKSSDYYGDNLSTFNSSFTNTYGDLSTVKSESSSDYTDYTVEVVVTEFTSDTVEQTFNLTTDHAGNNETNSDAEQVVEATDYTNKCQLNSDDTPCECYRACLPPPKDDRQVVCGKSNTTYESDCLLYYQKCQCLKDMSSCKNLAVANESLDYYGGCKELESCQDFSYDQFFDRISHWISTSVSDWVSSWYKNKSYSYDKEVDPSLTAGFLFCLHDINRNMIWETTEVSHILATFKVIEPCFQRFLLDCDTDKDGSITMKEWANCLKIDGVQSLKVDCKM